MNADPSTSDEIRRFEAQYEQNPESLVFARLADAYRKAGDPEKALALLQEGIARHSDYPSAYIVRARAFRDMGRDQEAEGSFRRVLELDARNLVAVQELAALAVEKGDQGEARTLYELLTQIDPSNAAAREKLAQLGPADAFESPGVVAPPDVSHSPPEEARVPDAEAYYEAAPDRLDDSALSGLKAMEPVVAEEGPEPAVEGVSEPAVEEGPERTVEAAVELPADALAEPPGEESTEPVAEAIREPVAKEMPEPVLGTAPEPVAEEMTAAARETDREPWAEEVMAPPLEEIPESVAGEVPGPAAEALVEPEAEETAEAAPEESVEPITESPTGASPTDPDTAWWYEHLPESAVETKGDADMLTRTMADLYARQGLIDEAAEIYEELLQDRPGDPELTAALDEIRARQEGRRRPDLRRGGPDSGRGALERPGMAELRAGAGAPIVGEPEKPSVAEELRLLLRAGERRAAAAGAPEPSETPIAEPVSGPAPTEDVPSSESAAPEGRAVLEDWLRRLQGGPR